MLVRLGGRAREDDILLAEDWLDQIRGPREPLAKPTMANGDALRLCERLVADVAAQASSLVSHRHVRQAAISLQTSWTAVGAVIGAPSANAR